MRPWAYVISAAMLASLLGYGVHIVRKASRVDAAEARAETAEQGRAADMAEIVKRLDDSAKDREALVARFDAIDKRFDEIKIPEPGKLVLTKEVPGACPVSGVSLDLVGVWNDAARPIAAPP